MEQGSCQEGVPIGPIEAGGYDRERGRGRGGWRDRGHARDRLVDCRPTPGWPARPRPRGATTWKTKRRRRGDRRRR